MSEELLGTMLPTVELDSTEGKRIKLPEDLKGRWTVLYFYPKDDTPGCTKEACTYTDQLTKFKNIGAMIYGVSLDDVDSHNKFKEKYRITFPLLSDTEKTLSEALGVYQNTNFMGKLLKMLSRDTFLIDPEGKIAKIWRKVNPVTSVDDTYNEIVNLSKK